MCDADPSECDWDSSGLFSNPDTLTKNRRGIIEHNNAKIEEELAEPPSRDEESDGEDEHIARPSDPSKEVKDEPVEMEVEKPTATEKSSDVEMRDVEKPAPLSTLSDASPPAGMPPQPLLL